MVCVICAEGKREGGSEEGIKGLSQKNSDASTSSSNVGSRKLKSLKEEAFWNRSLWDRVNIRNSEKKNIIIEKILYLKMKRRGTLRKSK